MATLFTRIIDGEIPGRFIWRDDRAVAFSSIAPLVPGHLLVVPIVEVDHWLDLDEDLAGHLFSVARVIGRAQMDALSPNRVGLIIAGLEVPHTHLHVVPIQSEADLDFARADGSAGAIERDDAAAQRIREALWALGRPEVVEA